VFLVTGYARLSTTAECIPSTHLEAGPGKVAHPRLIRRVACQRQERITK
jgi:hypothetical protein